jgi:hypothetical protein
LMRLLPDEDWTRFAFQACSIDHSDIPPFRIKELPSAIGIPDPKSGFLPRALNVEQNLQDDVDFQQAGSSYR